MNWSGAPSAFTSTAFRFFEPITAPMPPRPATPARWRRVESLATMANFTSFSPAGPMVATR
jgi:hypothetical protein